MLGTNYDNPAKLEINTFQGLFFDSRENDIFCSIDNQFFMPVENQSSVNKNMPFRFLAYVTELLNKSVTDKRKLYKEQVIRFLTPKFLILYNGNDYEPVEKIMRLSEAFGEDSSSLELVVTAYNINRGVNEEVFDMLALEWNFDDALQARFEDSMERGEINRAEKMLSK